MKFIIICISCLMFLTGCNNNNGNNNNNSNNNNSTKNTDSYTTEKLSTYENIAETNENTTTSNQTIEEPLASFSTKVSQKDPDRQTNITLACNSLNGIIIKAGETFSFCDTLGPAKPEDGYKKADAFDGEGNTIQTYGGGKCQVSTTMYNAVLAVPTLTVVERHEHSGPVYYVEEGKDACVSYGSCDFKFTNNNEFDIKMYVSNTPDSVDVSIVKISS